MDENMKEVRTHRVGSITLGSALAVSYTHLLV